VQSAAKERNDIPKSHRSRNQLLEENNQIGGAKRSPGKHNVEEEKGDTLASSADSLDKGGKQIKGQFVGGTKKTKTNPPLEDPQQKWLIGIGRREGF